MDPILGQIIMFAGNFPPRGWEFCDGQLIPIAQNPALFSIIGTTYGGDGMSTFALPDLRGRVPIHSGGSTGPGLRPYNLGEAGGAEVVTLTNLEMPQHNHIGSINVGDENGGVTTYAAGSFLGDSLSGDNIYRTTGTGQSYGYDPNGIQGVQITPTGGNQPHDNMQPYLGVNFIIATEGRFPERHY